MSAREPVPQAEADNAAWVTLELPVSRDAVWAFVGDLGRLLRLNPFLDIESWDGPPGPVAGGNRYRLRALNEMNGIRYDVSLTVDGVDPELGYRASYDRGLKRALEVSISPDGKHGTLLSLREHYHTPPEDEREARLAEIDRSLTPWGASVRRHLIRLRRWGWLPGYERFMNGFWLSMSPRQRRISRLIGWVTVAEFVVFLFLVAIFWSEAGR